MHDGHRTCANPYAQPNFRPYNNGDSFGYRFSSNRNCDPHSDRWAELYAYRNPDPHSDRWAEPHAHRDPDTHSNADSHTDPHRTSRVGRIAPV